MPRKIHEIRDPIHVFIRLNTSERKVLDSYPLQRLRHIHQLATTYLVYPGATHKRFEHSLGVMELATRVYDVVTNPLNIYHDSVRKLIPTSHLYEYWRLVLRMAALCHDVGHLPFSHAAEKELLPKDWDHERMTIEIIRSPHLQIFWDELKINKEDVAKLSVGAKKYKDSSLSVWEAILSEIIVGDAFGVDRMDYLLRDSHHTGVTYGKFDHYRLIDTLRILPKEQKEKGSEEPTLGIEAGGLHSTEALLIARYFMYKQLYFHNVRRIYDIHLRDFLVNYFRGDKFPTDVNSFLNITDNDITSEILKASSDKSHIAHDPARRIVKREHYKKFYESNPADKRINPDAAKAVYVAAIEKYGKENIRIDSYAPEGNITNFPVYTDDKRIISFLNLSTLDDIQKPITIDYLFVNQDIRGSVDEWLHGNLIDIITPRMEE